MLRRGQSVVLDAAVLPVPTGRSSALGTRHHQRPSSWRGGEEGEKKEDGEEEEEENSLRVF